jgi:tetratricopeptide (TPR) repeat protein
MAVTAGDATPTPTPGVPLTASDYVAQGKAYLEQGDYEQAIAAFGEALRLDPDYACAYVNRGYAYAMHGKYARAIADFDEAIRLDPDYAYAYVNRGYAYAMQGEYARAIADYDEAIRLDPDYAYAYVNRGRAYAMQGDLARAIADYDEAIRLDPDFAGAYYNRGLAYAEQDEYAQAITDYDEAIRLNPDYAKAYGNRGYAYYAQGEYARAIADYDEAIRLDPSNAWTYIDRGIAYYYQSKYARAIADFDEAIRLDPDFALAYAARGHAYHMLGKYDQALADLNEYVRLAGVNADQAVIDLIAQIEAAQASTTLGDEPVAKVEVGSPLVREDFNDDSRWPVGPVADVGRMDLREGQYWLIVSVARKTIQATSLPIIQDAYLEAEVHLDACPPDGFFAVSARGATAAPDVISSGYYILFPCNLGSWTIGVYGGSSGGWRVLAHAAFTSVSDNAAKQHVVGVWLKEDTLKLYLDGVELGSATEDTFDSGLVGLYAEAGEQDAILKVESLRVWQLP